MTALSGKGFIVNDVTRLNPVPVLAVVKPTTIEDVRQAVLMTKGAISVGGGHFSMGGQTASDQSVHLDMRDLTGVLSFDPPARTIRVLAGTRWCDLQRFLDPHDLSVKIMQTYSNFTVGGSLSVNCHGRYMGLGPVVMSVREITLVMADGRIETASRHANSDLFYAAIGGYGGIGIIVAVEFDLARNERVERLSKTMRVADYLDFFRDGIRADGEVVFHNADLYPPHYDRLRAVSWRKTKRAATHGERLQTPRRQYALERYFMWSMTEGPRGPQRREHVIDPLLYLKDKVHWRNYEAGYDVAELEPEGRDRRTYVLQEYFVPIRNFEGFTRKMAEILRRHRVNTVNVSIRHALSDPGTLLAWAKEECFAFVLYYKQRTRENAKARVAVWTRELIEAALSEQGCYYLPYQIHATHDQFHRAYPRAREFFALKDKVDPDYRLRNRLWDAYYRPANQEPSQLVLQDSEFKTVFSTVSGRDDFYRFLQTVFNLRPEDRFHRLICEETQRGDDDEAIYRALQARMAEVTPKTALLTHAVPALGVQKREMVEQTLTLLGERRRIDGYLEIGTTGRYISLLRKKVSVSGPIYLLNGAAPSNSPVDILERGGLRKIGTHVPHGDDAPIAAADVPDASIELVTCFPGIHHIAPEKLPAFLDSVVRVLKPGGLFVLRDHHVPTPEMFAFVALVHTVFNAGTGVPWPENAAEPRYFDSLDHWVGLLANAGLEDLGFRLLQANDPSANTLMAFRKPVS
jgi:FAD/FMN-containing dehydrogenase